VIPPVISPPRVVSPTRDVPPSDDDRDDGPDADMSVSDMRKLLHGDVHDADDLDDHDLFDEDYDPMDESIKTRFSRERLLPILKSAGLAANVEFEGEEKPESSLLFGGLGLRSRKVTPMVRMPPEVCTAQEEVRSSYKGALGNSRVFNTIFRVPEDDFVDYFNPPAFDADALQFFAPLKSKKQWTYLPAWEEQLVKLDREIRGVSRLAAFQLLILNNLTIQLSDDESGEGHEPDSPFAMARLTAELAGQQIKQLMRISHATIPMRRNNVCAGLSGAHKEDIASRLKGLRLDSQSLFAGKFTEALKEVHKKIKREQAIGKVVQSETSTYRSRGKGKGASKSSSSSYGNSRSHPYGNRGKGRGSTQHSDNSGSSSYRGGRGGNRQGGRGQGRGRGRGRPQSRF